jgi:hypothetical protein
VYILLSNSTIKKIIILFFFLEMTTMLRKILIGLVIFNIIDYIATTRAIAHGAEEYNPIMNAILHSPLFPVYKLLIIPAALYWAWSVRAKWQHNRVILASMFGLFVVYATLTGWHLWGTFCN